MDMRDVQEERCEALSLRVFSVNPGDSGKKSGYSGKSGESGLEMSGVFGFHSQNPKSQCHAHRLSKLRDIADLEPIESAQPIP
jgi:hypothetical protein